MKVVLIGNPNTGKSTLFNDLTGLNQKIGNFPGVTVEKKQGTAKVTHTQSIELIDLPGIYSLYPKSADEKIAFQVLCDPSNQDFPDLVMVVTDASNLKRNLLLFTQVADLGLPTVLVLNMIDLAHEKGMAIDVSRLSALLGVPVVPINARDKTGLIGLKKAIAESSPSDHANKTIEVDALAPQLIGDIREHLTLANPYRALQVAHQSAGIGKMGAVDSEWIEHNKSTNGFDSIRLQSAETLARFGFVSGVLADCVSQEARATKKNVTQALDKILTHKIWGLAIFVFILFVVFQSIFSMARYPMDAIDGAFVWLEQLVKDRLPAGNLTDLLADGILAGLSGVMQFVPQIVILFAFIAILEDTGYMARVSFMMDKLMRNVGLNGRSIVPLIGGVACAVPAIMSTRTIENWKDRIITIMVTPLMSCSARLPVYTLLISLVVPNKRIWGLISYQGLTLLFLYLIGFFAAILSAWVIKHLVGTKTKGYFIMELPVYRLPRWNNILYTLVQKTQAFIGSAGKIILAISVVLWVLSSYGPPGVFNGIHQKYERLQVSPTQNKEALQAAEKSEKLENSFAGILGHSIEPVIRPLGFDWKIGIALITSFVAREVFVGTMATIYSAGGDESHIVSVREKMRGAIDPETGKPIFTLAVGFSLMIFYAFAMQCTSTLAVVYRETRSWKWPVIQFLYMTGLAYFSSVIVFHIFK